MQLLGIIDTIAAATAKRGIDVVDRGGDRIELYKPLLDRDLRFIIRLRGDRHLVVRGRASSAAQMARGADAVRGDGGARGPRRREETPLGIRVSPGEITGAQERGVDAGGGARVRREALVAADQRGGQGQSAVGGGGS